MTMPPKKEMTPIAWAKLSSGFHSNRKARRAGRAGRELFVYVMCMNAARGSTGSIPLADLELWHVAEQLQMTEDEARAAISRCCQAQLIDITNTETGPRAFIVGWGDEWSRRPMTDAERKALQRLRESSKQATSKDVTSDVTNVTNGTTPIVTVTHERRGEERKRDEKKGEENVSRRSTRAASGKQVEPELVGYKDVIAEFDRRFREAYNTGPTWNARVGSNAKALIRAHGHREVIERIGNLFTAPPAWLRPPFDFATLMQHFDKLALPASAAPARVSPQQEQMNRQLDRVRMLEEKAKQPHDFDGDADQVCRLCGMEWSHNLHGEDDPPWE